MVTVCQKNCELHSVSTTTAFATTLATSYLNNMVQNSASTASKSIVSLWVFTAEANTWQHEHDCNQACTPSDLTHTTDRKITRKFTMQNANKTHIMVITQLSITNVCAQHKPEKLVSVTI